MGGLTSTGGFVFGTVEFPSTPVLGSELGLNFIRGNLMGIMEGKDNMVLHRLQSSEDGKGILNYFRTLIQTYSTYARKYLVYGELLRPLYDYEDISTSQLIKIKTRFGGGREDNYYVPKVSSSVWKANDGTFGLIFTNYNKENQATTFNFQYSNYDIPNGTRFSLSKLSENGPTYIKAVGGDFAQTITLDPYSVLVFGLSPDTTPPSTPVVTDEGQFTTKKDQLYASWTSEDKESGIAEYQYRITEPTGRIIRNWTSAGTYNYVTAGALSLIDGRTYYFGVKAKNGAGLWSQIGYSDGITVDTIKPLITNKTTSPQKVGEPLLFQAQVTDSYSGVKEAHLILPQGAYSIQYNSQTRLYEVRISAFSQPATIPYRISARDKAGNLATTGTFYLKVVRPNRPPIARIIALPRSGRSPLRVQFSGYRSYDPDGRIVSYLWNFGDGTTSTQINPIHYFYNNSRLNRYYTVTLTVKDDKGASATVRITITVYPKKRK